LRPIAPHVYRCLRDAIVGAEPDPLELIRDHARQVKRNAGNSAVSPRLRLLFNVGTDIVLAGLANVLYGNPSH
jgi:hypothetical protein